MLAFHNDPIIKEKYLKRVNAHYKADEIIHGAYWQNGKGCAVGCTVEKNSNAHEAMEKELGIPKDLAFLEDRIFEGLENGLAKEFPLKFLKAITPGADLSKVTAKFIIWLLADPKDGVMRFAFDDGKKAIKEVVKLYKEELKGKKVSSAAWSAAWSAARSAAWSAESAAWSAARSAESAARSAESAAYRVMSEKLIELLKECE